MLAYCAFRNWHYTAFELSIPDVEPVNHDCSAVCEDVNSQRFPQHLMWLERTAVHLSDGLAETWKMVAEIKMIDPLRYIAVLILPLSCILADLTKIAIASKYKINPWFKTHDSIDPPLLWHFIHDNILTPLCLLCSQDIFQTQIIFKLSQDHF